MFLINNLRGPLTVNSMLRAEDLLVISMLNWALLIIGEKKIQLQPRLLLEKF